MTTDEQITATDYRALQLIHFCQIYADAYSKPICDRASYAKERALARANGISDEANTRAQRGQQAAEAALDYACETDIPEHRLGAALTAAGAYQILRAAGAAGQYLIETTIAHYHATIDDYDPDAHNHP